MCVWGFGVAASNSSPYLAAVRSIWSSVPLVQMLKCRFGTFELYESASVNYSTALSCINCAIQQTTLQYVQEGLTYRIFFFFFWHDAPHSAGKSWLTAAVILFLPVTQCPCLAQCCPLLGAKEGSGECECECVWDLLIQSSNKMSCVVFKTQSCCCCRSELGGGSIQILYSSKSINTTMYKVSSRLLH